MSDIAEDLKILKGLIDSQKRQLGGLTLNTSEYQTHAMLLHLHERIDHYVKKHNVQV